MGIDDHFPFRRIAATSDNDALFFFFCFHTDFFQTFCHSSQSVAFFDAQSACVIDDCFTFCTSTSYAKDRYQIRDLRSIDFDAFHFFICHSHLVQDHFTFCTECFQQRNDSSVALSRFHIQTLTADAAFDGTCSQPERCIAPITFCKAHTRAFKCLSTRNDPSIFFFLHFYTKCFQCFQCHIDITNRFHCCCQVNFAVTFQQRQCKQEACDKLRTDIAG